MLTVRHVLNIKGNNVWTINPHTTAYKALQIMADKNVGALLVIDNEKVVGIFSERDYARKVILHGKSSKETAVGELMSTTVYSITPEKSVEECMALMNATRIRHVPVLEDGKLIGIMSIGDVVNAIISDQKITIRDLENYISGSDFVFSLH